MLTLSVFEGFIGHLYFLHRFRRCIKVEARGLSPRFAACLSLYDTSGCCLALEDSSLPQICIRVLCSLLTPALTSVLGHSLAPPTPPSLCRSPGVSHFSFSTSRQIYPGPFRMTIGLRGSWAAYPGSQAFVSDFCSSLRAFVSSFLQIPSRPGHPCFQL